MGLTLPPSPTPLLVNAEKHKIEKFSGYNWNKGAHSLYSVLSSTYKRSEAERVQSSVHQIQNHLQAILKMNDAAPTKKDGKKDAKKDVKVGDKGEDKKTDEKADKKK